MEILTRGAQKQKLLLGARLQVVPFLGIDDAQGGLNGGVGLSKPDSEVITFQPMLSGTMHLKRVYGAMMILDEVEQVSLDTLSDCLCASLRLGYVDSDCRERLSESFYEGVEYDVLMRSVVNVPDEHISPFVQRANVLISARLGAT